LGVARFRRWFAMAAISLRPGAFLLWVR
jgi:hypothetical protein